MDQKLAEVSASDDPGEPLNLRQERARKSSMQSRKESYAGPWLGVGYQPPSSGGGSLRADWQLGSGTLSSITGWRALHSRIGFDQTAASPGAGNVILLQDQHGRSFSHELQYTAKTLEGRLDWLAAAYIFHEHNDQLTAVSAATPAGSRDARFRNGDFFNALSRGTGTSGNWSPYEPQLDTSSWSVFGSATLALGERTNVTAGLRYTDERKIYDVRLLSAPETVLVLSDGRVARRRISEHWTDLSPASRLTGVSDRPCFTPPPQRASAVAASTAVPATSRSCLTDRARSRPRRSGATKRE